MIKSKHVKFAALKLIVLRFSEFRPILTSIPTSSQGKSGAPSEISRMSYNSTYNPNLFAKIGGIDKLTKIFEMFFDEAS